RLERQDADSGKSLAVLRLARRQGCRPERGRPSARNLPRTRPRLPGPESGKVAPPADRGTRRRVAPPARVVWTVYAAGVYDTESATESSSPDTPRLSAGRSRQPTALPPQYELAYTIRLPTHSHPCSVQPAVPGTARA